MSFRTRSIPKIQRQQAEEEKENTTSEPPPRIPKRPPTFVKQSNQPVAAGRVANSAPTTTSTASRLQMNKLSAQHHNPFPTPHYRMHSKAPHDPIAGLRQVDSDNESDDDEAAKLAAVKHVLGKVVTAAGSANSSLSSTPIPHGTTTTTREGILSNASSFRRSAAVSRQNSDLAGGGTPAGTGFQLLRQMSGTASASVTPTERGLSRVTSRSNSILHPTLEGCDSVAISRRNSLTHSASATPELHRMTLKVQRQEDDQKALEDDIARRHALFAPENVLIRRWLSTICIARATKTLVESGGLRVSEYQARQRALQTLTHLLLPIWKLHVVRRRRKSQQIIQRFILKMMIRRRMRKRHEAIGIVKHFLKNKSAMFRCYAKWFVHCAVTIQRAFRRFKARRDAMVELNYRLVRKVESSYWEMAAFAAQEVLDDRYSRDVAEARGRRSRASVAEIVHEKIPTTYPTLETIGHLPESVVKKNLRPLVSAMCKEWRAEVDRRIQQAFENFKKVRRGSIGALSRVPEMSKRCITVKLPTFKALLPNDDLFGALDDTVRTIAALRDMPIMELHLSDGRKTQVPFGGFSQVGGGGFGSMSSLSMKSSILGGSGGGERKCSLSNLFK